MSNLDLKDVMDNSTDTNREILKDFIKSDIFEMIQEKVIEYVGHWDIRCGMYVYKHVEDIPETDLSPAGTPWTACDRIWQTCALGTAAYISIPELLADCTDIVVNHFGID